jgi:Type IV secretory system Conjugative DNA transfer
VLCFAPTRSGKGVGLVVPTLLTWPGSCIVHDIKGENWTLPSPTASVMRSQSTCQSPRHACAKRVTETYRSIPSACYPSKYQ